MPTNKKTTAPLDHYADKQVTPLIEDFAAWLTEQTGVKVDPMSVYLGSALRGTFQSSDANQRRLKEQAERVAAEKVARDKRAVERASKVAKPQPATKKAPAKKPATVKAPVRRRPLKVEGDA